MNRFANRSANSAASFVTRYLFKSLSFVPSVSGATLEPLSENGGENSLVGELKMMTDVN